MTHCPCRLCEHDSAARWQRWLAILAIGCAALMFAAAAAHGGTPGAPPPSVVQIDGCSGVCVHPSGVFMTAKHCQFDNRETVEFPDGSQAATRKVFESPDTDGPVVLVADSGGPFPFSPLAESHPAVGTRVYSWGFPAGAVSHARNLSYADGVVSGGRKFTAAEVGLMPLLPAYSGNTVDGLATDGGWSGGPLFNEAGEVCGLCSASNSQGSIWITYTATRDAYQIALAKLPASAVADRCVTYYTQPNCEPCRKFETDKEAGRFTGYKFEAGDTDSADIEGTPTFVYLGQQYTGYNGAASLKAWLAECERQRPPVVAERMIPEPDPGPTPAPGVTPFKRRPSEDIAALREQITDLVADVKAFQDAGVIGKVGAINDLRADAADARETASIVQAELAQMKADAAGHPWYYGIPAALFGVIKRRYLNRGAVVEA